jgi:hypothetical protein
MAVSGQLHASAALLSGKQSPGSHRTRSLVFPSAGPEVQKKYNLFLLRVEPQFFSLPARSVIAITQNPFQVILFQKSLGTDKNIKRTSCLSANYSLRHYTPI